MSQPAVVHEERNFIAVYKPAGMLVHASARPGSTQAGTLVEWLLARFPKLSAVGDDPVGRPGIVHRLDKDTSGIMLVPRTQEYFLYLKSLFMSRKVEKTYLALVWGQPKEEGSIRLPIGIRSGTVRRTVRGGKMVKDAHTDYRLVRRLPRTSLLEVHPRTGRTHQIRVHLAAEGAPVVGDPLYGRKRKEPWITRLMLHAYAIEFPPSPGATLRLVAEPDAEFAAVLDAAERDAGGVVHS